ncbi:MAG: metallophosphoesterase [Alphaproteobacteria bacterium]
MLARLWRSVCLGLAAFAASVPAAAVPPPQPARIVAVGDLHGDYTAWSAIARDAGITGPNGNWTGGRTTLVQVGDMVDRGPDSLKIVRELMRLQKEAPRQGGRVIVLTGNHEAMNVTGDLRYTTEAEFTAFAGPKSAELRDQIYEAKKKDIEAKYRASNPSLSSAAIRELWIKETPLGWAEQRLAWAPDGEIGRWIVRNPAVAQLGGNLFVHGGLSAEYSELSIDAINAQVAAALKAVDRSPTSILRTALGPLWYRGHVTRDPKATEIAPPAAGMPQRPSIEEELDQVLAAYEAKRIIVGHTPSLPGIRIDHGGRLVRIDTGNSRYYSGTLSWLEIVGDKLIPHKVARPPASGGRE